MGIVWGKFFVANLSMKRNADRAGCREWDEVQVRSFLTLKAWAYPWLQSILDTIILTTKMSTELCWPNLCSGCALMSADMSLMSLTSVFLLCSPRHSRALEVIGSSQPWMRTWCFSLWLFSRQERGCLMGPEEARQTNSWCDLCCCASPRKSAILQMGLDNKRDFLFGYAICPYVRGFSGLGSPRTLSLALQNHKDNLFIHRDKSEVMNNNGLCSPSTLCTQIGEGGIGHRSSKLGGNTGAALHFPSVVCRLKNMHNLRVAS